MKCLGLGVNGQDERGKQLAFLLARRLDGHSGGVPLGRDSHVVALGNVLLIDDRLEHHVEGGKLGVLLAAFAGSY